MHAAASVAADTVVLVVVAAVGHLFMMVLPSLQPSLSTMEQPTDADDKCAVADEETSARASKVPSRDFYFAAIFDFRPLTE